MALSPGTRLGVYEVTAPIGEGGMGQVYRARDTKLDRDVAIKILPEAFAHDADRLERFEREAKTLASLNHSNIAQIFGLEQAGDVHALVMELVSGEDLSQRVARGAIPLDEALPIAKQIAAALDAAHEQGIVHRDLKPANIKLRPNGIVKVLDFGLAKLIPVSNSAPKAVGLSQSPTLTSPVATRIGTIMGTAAYMSPEQTRAMPVDARTDIWAFGCVLYEMLTGLPVFAGETIPDTIARVLEREPDWRALPFSTPPEMRELLRACLQKDPQHRLQHIAQITIALDRIATAKTTSRSGIGVRMLAGGTLLAAVLSSGAWWFLWRTIPIVPHAPVSVLIADLENQTNDPIFDRTLEPMIRIVLEGADFITAYDRNRIRSTFGVQSPETLSEGAAREIAVRQGLGIVLAGTIAPRASGYDISLRALRSVSGDEISEANGRADSKEQVLSVATSLVTGVRRALGEQGSDSDPLLEMKSVSTRSLEAVSHFSAAMSSQANGRYDDARRSLLKAVELDPSFGLVYQGLAAMSRNQGRLKEAQSHITQALRHLDEMTERERFYTRALYYRLTGDYEQCAREYGEIAAQYTADPIAHNQRALCASKLRDLRLAIDEMRQALKLFPSHTIFRAISLCTPLTPVILRLLSERRVLFSSRATLPRSRSRSLNSGGDRCWRRPTPTER